MPKRIFVSVVAGLVGCSLFGCRPVPVVAPRGGTIVVEVVDSKGAPLADVEVEGLVDFNPGPVASTCCAEKRFATAKTSETGRATLAGAPFTFRAFHFRASFRDWPPREVSTSSLVGRHDVIHITLGPAREVRGRVDLGPDCPQPSGLEVSASPSETRAKVAADGSFLFKSLAPWAYLSVYACGRGARFDLEIGDNRPVILTLPRAESR